jgi:biopolymer transport protein ExbD
MAELQVAQKDGRRKGHSLRIDFTPMVDLGFLLITFFMYTTTIANPKTMEINMPYNGPGVEPSPVPAESAITIIPCRGHQVVYYEGLLTGPASLRKCTIDEARAVLMRKKSKVANLPASFSASAHKLHVLIKPGIGATYGDVVRLLDEMNIVGISYYALVDMPSEESQIVENKMK